MPDSLTAHQLRNILNEMFKLPNDALPSDRRLQKHLYASKLDVTLGKQVFTITVEELTNELEASR